MKRWLTVAIAAVLLLAACGDDDNSDDEGGAAGEGGTVKLRAAPNDPEDATIAVLAFLPTKATVATGSEVEWSFEGPEPHSVSFFPTGQAVPSPDQAGQFFQPTGNEASYDGTALVNSGLRPFGPAPAEPFKVTFPKAGDFSYVCVIHPQMKGTVTVTDSEDAVDSQDDITERGDEEYDTYLEEGREAKEKLEGSKAGASPAWTVEMGATTQSTDVLAFAPDTLKVKVGDKITFINNSGAPHTASFGGDLVPQNPEDPKAQAPAPGPSPQPLTAGAYINSGLLPPNAPPGGGPPPQVRSFTFTATKAGTYSYVCIFHAPSKMVGTITVE